MYSIIFVKEILIWVSMLLKGSKTSKKEQKIEEILNQKKYVLGEAKI